MLALRESVDRQDVDSSEIRLQERLEYRQRSMRLPLLIAQNADALAVKGVEPPGVPLSDLQLSRRIVEFQINHAPAPEHRVCNLA
jgi:hypothetical protein